MNLWRLLTTGFAVVFVGTAAWLIWAFLLPVWLFHPLGACTPTPRSAYLACRSYNFWSGIAGSFLCSLPGWTVAIGLFLKQHNCHHHRCLRLGRHHTTHGLLCRKHHVQAGGLIPGKHYELTPPGNQ